MPKEIFCAFGVDVDAVAGWLGSYGGEVLAAAVAVDRLDPALRAARGDQHRHAAPARLADDLDHGVVGVPAPEGLEEAPST